GTSSAHVTTARAATALARRLRRPGHAPDIGARMNREPMRTESVDVAAQAARAAGAATSAVGVRIVELDTVDRVLQAADLFNAVWSATREEPLIPANTLRAIQHSGNYLFGAYDGDVLIG